MRIVVDQHRFFGYTVNMEKGEWAGGLSAEERQQGGYQFEMSVL